MRLVSYQTVRHKSESFEPHVQVLVKLSPAELASLSADAQDTYAALKTLLQPVFEYAQELHP